MKSNLTDYIEYRVDKFLPMLIGKSIEETYYNIVDFTSYVMLYEAINISTLKDETDKVLFENTPETKSRKTGQNDSQSKQTSPGLSSSTSSTLRNSAQSNIPTNAQSKQGMQNTSDKPATQQNSSQSNVPTGKDQLKMLVPGVGGAVAGIAARDYGIKQGYFKGVTDIDVKIGDMSPEKYAKLKEAHGGSMQQDSMPSMAPFKGYNPETGTVTMSGSVYQKANQAGDLGSHEITSSGTDFTGGGAGATVTGIVAGMAANLLIKGAMNKMKKRREAKQAQQQSATVK